MGLIRKAIAGSAAVMTGGLSLGVVQYRSDTERGTRQTKKLRKELQRRGAATPTVVIAQSATMPAHSPTAPSPQPDRLDQLQRLHELHARGVLTDEEYGLEKARILDAM